MHLLPCLPRRLLQGLSRRLPCRRSRHLASLAGLAVLCLLPARAPAQPVVYELDPERTQVHFEVLHFNTSTTRGRFGPIRGSVTLDRSAGTGEVGLRIATASVSTGIPVFDARLRQDDLLASQAHPEAFFVARRFELRGGQVASVHGEFTLRGISQPLTLSALRFACRNDGERQREVCAGDFEARLQRSDFGASFGLPVVADTVRLVVQVEAHAPLSR